MRVSELVGKTVVRAEGLGDGAGEECKYGLKLVFDDDTVLDARPTQHEAGVMDVEIENAGEESG